MNADAIREVPRLLYRTWYIGAQLGFENRLTSDIPTLHISSKASVQKRALI
jgi:hypothetical protein